VDVKIHYSAELGSETDVFGYMVQGVSVDFGIITPNSVTKWAPIVSILSAPFVFRDLEHWKKVIHSDALSKIENAVEDVGVLVFGWEGGSFRNLILKDPINETSDLSRVKLRVQQAPIQEKIFGAIGFKTVPIVYQEVYDAIRTGVADGLENEPAGYRDMKFYEVAPNFVLSEHTIATWGFMFSKKTYDSLPADLQKAIARAGAEAAEYHTELETSKYETVIQQLIDEYGVNVVEFDNSRMREVASPILADFAKEVDAVDVLEAINAVR
jgi:TRAP-type C4-dicarboxylate transport system substrate-binding protein